MIGKSPAHGCALATNRWRRAAAGVTPPGRVCRREIRRGVGDYGEIWKLHMGISIKYLL